MAHLWERNDTGEWEAVPADGDLTRLVPGLGSALADVPDRDLQSLETPVLLRLSGPGAREAWVLLTPPTVHLRVNGAPLHSGIRVLHDRDAIQLTDGSPTYFSTERLAVLEPFPGSPEPVYCPRCRTEIARASMAVCCPNCRAWHHQDEEFGCWLYADSCAMCDQPTALDSGFRWHPGEDL